jgi:hypothetical protein
MANDCLIAYAIRNAGGKIMMNRIFRIGALVILSIVFFAGCALFGPGTAEVRFQNLTSDINFFYGLKVADAEFLFEGSDEFSPGEVTEYQTIVEGSYSIQAQDDSGNWLTISSGTFRFDPGVTYTISIEGSLSTTLGFRLITDG